MDVTCRPNGEELEPLVTVRLPVEGESVRVGSLA
jgi:hypothetical protein